MNFKPTPDEVEEEHVSDIRTGELEPILWKLEEKGAKMNIASYKEMQTLRARRNKRVQDKLEEFGPTRSIIDSSQVTGALLIAEYFRRRKARGAAQELAKEQEVQPKQGGRSKDGEERPRKEKKNKVPSLASPGSTLDDPAGMNPSS